MLLRVQDQLPVLLSNITTLLVILLIKSTENHREGHFHKLRHESNVGYVASSASRKKLYFTVVKRFLTPEFGSCGRLPVEMETVWILQMGGG